MNNKSINFRIPLYITIFALTCVIITGLISQVLFRDQMEEQIESKNMIISKMIASELDLYLNNALDTVVTAANFSSQSYGDLHKIEEEIFRIHDNFNYFDLIYFMNNDAKMVFSKPPNHLVEGRSYKDRDYYWDIIGEGKDRTVSALLISSVLNRPHFIIAAPVKNDVEDIIGLIGAGIPLENLESIIQGVEAFDGKVWIVDEEGSLVTHPDYVLGDTLVSLSELGLSLDNDNFKEILMNQMDMNVKYSKEGVNFYGSVSFVGNHGWMVVVEQNASTIAGEISNAMSRLLIFEFIVLIIALILGFFIARSITVPVSELVKQVRSLPEDLSKGQITISEKIENRDDEIYELSHAFEEMGNQLKRNIEDLEIAFSRENRLQRYLNNILASVHSGIIVADANEKITMVNRQAVEISGYSDEEIPDNIFEFMNILGIKIVQCMDNPIEESILCTDVESDLLTRKGETLIISYSCTPVIDPKGRYFGFVFQFRDITKLKKIEAELRKEDRIHTMGELSASIIHDIGNPLAGMSNLLEILGDNEIDQASKQEVLSLLVQEVNDLNLLVINFLDFAKSGSNVKNEVDLVSILRNVVDLFRKEMRDRDIDINYDYQLAHARVYVNARSVKQAIINIFKNALEAIEGHGNITLRLKSSDGEVVLEIIDSGKGMTEEAKEKLFYPFYTTKDEGTGLGLFIAYTSLKENCCDLDVESNEKGTAFKISFKNDAIEMENSN